MPKRYEWFKLQPILITSSRPPDVEKDMTPVDLDDPTLPDEFVEIDPNADAFTSADES